MKHLAVWKLAFLLLVLLVRGGALLAGAERLSADPDGYLALARNLVEQGVLGSDRQPSAYRPPLYPIMLTACLAAPCSVKTAIAALHLILGLATIWITVRLARRWRLGGFSYLAGGLVACDPILLHQSTLVMTETLAAFLAIASLAFVTAAGEPDGKSGDRRRLALAALAGASFAVAALCRPTFLVSLPLMAAALAYPLATWRQRLATIAALCSAAALVLLPWAARNYLQFGRPIVATTHGGYTLLLGNNRDYYDFLRTAPWRAVWRADKLDAALLASRSADELANDRLEYKRACQAIRRQPAMFAYASLLRVGSLWGVMPHRRNQEESFAARLARHAIAGWYLGVFGLGLTAVAVGKARLTRPPWLWAAMLAISFTIVHVVFWTDMRMRAPLVPALSLAAAAGLRRCCRRDGGVTRFC